jgi:Protein of unknown function (DUF1553)/Protein of unknown function (DUF1549)/Planctomycete cytochrome C
MGRNLNITIVTLCATFFGLLIAPRNTRAADEGPDATKLEFFEKKVRPVLAENCFKCHGPLKQKGGLRLDSLTSMMKGGDSGPAVSPGKPEASRLIEAIGYVEDPQMPPSGKLKENEISVLTQWVRMGTPWPAEARDVHATIAPAPASVAQSKEPHWAFQPVKSVAPPSVANAAWPKSPIDAFVLAKLEQKGLRPVSPADKRTLIRRATFDLIGLPPSVEDVEAFLSDDSADAFAHVVDRLLASPHYGERWGRHWLDVARYGEDQAHTFESRKYPNGFRYRDWVVKAFNEDMPYDRFITEQIAGDLLEGADRDDRLAALGFFALGPVYYGKAVLDELDDRVDTLTRGFLGLTVACARCHDHKFDPIPTKDYYALAGIFSNTAYKEYPQAPPEVVAKYDQAQAEIKAKTSAMDAFLDGESVRLAEAMTADTARYMVATWTLANKRKANPDVTVAEVAKQDHLRDFVLEKWFNYLFPKGKAKDAERPHLARWQKVIGAQDASIDLSSDDAARAEVQKAAESFQSFVCSLQKLRDAISEHKAARDANAVADGQAAPAVALALDEASANVLKELVSSTGLFAVPKAQVAKLLTDEPKKRHTALQAELERAKKDAPAKYPVIHSLAEGPSITNMKVHIRGNAAMLGEEAPRRFLSVLSAENAPSFSQGSGRLELASAIASKDNPLTARVMVNRIWEHHFGRGLVGTPSNFGSLGERPSHPELLDFLASRFVALGWSIKSLHREILLSSTYQLSSADDESNRQVDPDNRFLWHMNRRRLEVEAWRDAMLAVAGKLDLSLGGPSIDLTKPENNRRTFYAFISRHSLDGLLRLFDFPDPNITSDKRAVTTVPLQQLFVLNSDFMERQAKALATRLNGSESDDNASRIRRAFLLLFGRPASEEDVQLGLAFLAEKGPGNGEGGTQPSQSLSRWEQYAQVLLGSNEFAFVD